MPRFTEELSNLINKHSIDSLVGTQDFILAEYLACCISAFGAAKKDAERLSGEGFDPPWSPGGFDDRFETLLGEVQK